MKILFYYQLNEQLKPLFLSIAAISLLFLSGIVFDMGTYIIVRKVSPQLVGQLLLYKIPGVLIMTLPVAVLFSTLFVLGGMAKDWEIAAIRMAGVPCWKMVLPYVVVALIVSGISFHINEYVIPNVNSKAEVAMRKVIFESPPPELMQNVFFREKDRCYFINKIDPQTKELENVMIYELDKGKVQKIITAARGSYQDKLWTLADGVVHEFDAKGHMVYESDFSKLQVVAEETDEQLFKVGRTPQDMNMDELKEYIMSIKEKGIPTVYYEVEYYLKVSLHFAPVLFVLIGAPLILKGTIRDKLFASALCIGIAFLYYICSSVCSAAGRVQTLTPILAAWLPNMVFFTLGILGLWWTDHE
jgi:lipopolysaccharide export system permease protein